MGGLAGYNRYAEQSREPERRSSADWKWTIFRRRPVTAGVRRKRMAWWTIGYLVLFGLLAVAGLWDDARNRRPAWFLGCAVVSNVTVIYLFVAFWQPSLRVPLGWAAPVLFVASMCWELFQSFEDLRGLRVDPQVSETQQRAMATITAGVLLMVCLPAFIVAGISAFGG
ncbi:MAG: hypothetical protein R3B90_07850 [Planctomycetaceae bacterium]